MIGQAYSPDLKKYNVIILAAGGGTRMGTSADYIPKALVQLGRARAIDHIINRHMLVAHKFIVATRSHADLLEGYLRGSYQGMPIEFSRTTPEEADNNAWDALYAIDHVDSRHGVILTFCDLLIIEPSVVKPGMYLATDETAGQIGTFRHYVPQGAAKRCVHRHPVPWLANHAAPGVMGYFVFDDVLKLKETAYFNARSGLSDFTENIAAKYFEDTQQFVEVTKAIEFGTGTDLAGARKLWEAT